MNNRRFRDYLTDNKLKLIFENVLEKSKVFLQYVQIPGFTDHGFAHSERLEKILTNFLTDNHIRSLSQEEILVLLCSLFLHDIGMIPRNDEILEKTRKLHNIRSREYILNNANFLGTYNSTSAIAQVCYGHRDYEEESGEKISTLNLAPINVEGAQIDVQYLASLLRIADELDTCQSRAPKEVKQIYFQKTDPSIQFWVKHEIISGIEINPTLWQIKIYSSWDGITPPEIRQMLKFLVEVQQKINNEINKCVKIFSSKNIGYQYVMLDDRQYYQHLSNLQTEIIDYIKRAIFEGMNCLINAHKENEGWGPYKDNASRVANTAEALIGISCWPKIKDQNLKIDKDRLHQIIETSILWLENNRDERGGFISKTVGVASTHCTALVLYALSKILIEFEDLKDPLKEKINNLKDECIRWFTSIPESPLNIILKTEECDLSLFQQIYALRAINLHIKTLNNKSKADIRDLNQKYIKALNELLNFSRNKILGLSLRTPNPSNVINGMFLGLLGEAKVNNITEITNRTIDYLLEEKNRLSPELWEDESDEVILKGEKDEHRRPWTHFTTAWAIEGLVTNKDYLNTEQKLKLLDSIVLLLYFQKDDGYFYSSKPDKSSIFITALSIFALSKSIDFIQSEDWHTIIDNQLRH